MNFCIITPTAGLERYATLSTTHLVLAQVKDERYREFYKRKSILGEIVILDNGEYEDEKCNEQDLIEAIDYYFPKVVVLPDSYLKPWEETYTSSKAFLDKYYDKYPSIEWLYVPQAPKGDLFNWIDGVVDAIDTLPIEWVGIPRCLATDIYPHDEFIRVKACRWLKKRYPQLKIHALGMVSGNVKELHELALAGCDSCDSSAPVWRAWKYGLSLLHPDHHKVWKELGCEVDFGATDITKPYTSSSEINTVLPPDAIHNQILDNLAACGVDVSSLKEAVK